jgi:hypothetical protein
MNKTCSKLLATAFAMVALTTPAAADTAEASSAVAPQALQTFKNVGTGKCMDDSHEGLRVFPCNGLNYQKWQVTVWPNGTRELRNVATGRCVDHSHEGLRSFPCNRLDYQSWLVGKSPKGITFMNLRTGRYLWNASDGRNELRAVGFIDVNARWV